MANEMNVWKRIKGQTPLFFKRVIAVSLSLAAAGTALLSAEGIVTGFTLPPLLHTLSQWFVVAGIVAAAVSKTTVQTTDNNNVAAPKDEELQNNKP